MFGFGVTSGRKTSGGERKTGGNPNQNNISTNIVTVIQLVIIIMGRDLTVRPQLLFKRQHHIHEEEEEKVEEE